MEATNFEKENLFLKRENSFFKNVPFPNISGLNVQGNNHNLTYNVTKNDKNDMSRSENMNKNNKNYGNYSSNSYETYNTDEIQEFYKTEFIDSSNDESTFSDNLHQNNDSETYIHNLNKNKKHSEITDKKINNSEEKLKMEKTLLFQNEMLRNVLRSSQRMKEMQKELFNIDVHSFVPTLPPESKNSYSLQRGYQGIYDNMYQSYQKNNYNNVKNVNHKYYNNYGSNADKNEDSSRNNQVENIENNSEEMLVPHVPRIGEIKVNIDDIKKGLLTYYSHIYSLDQYDIEDRINILRYGEKNISDSINLKYLYLKKEAPNTPPFTYYNAELTNPNAPSYQNMPPDYYYNSRLNKNKNVLKGDVINLHANDYLEKTKLEERNIFENNFDHHGQFSELLSSLKNKCKDANFRIQNLASKFNEKYENPDNRFWVHNLVPPHLRKPALNDENDLRKHLVTVYAQLFNEAALNKKKITSLEKKLHILKLKSKIYKNQYKNETRNAL